MSRTQWASKHSHLTCAFVVGGCLGVLRGTSAALGEHSDELGPEGADEAVDEEAAASVQSKHQVGHVGQAGSWVDVLTFLDRKGRTMHKINSQCYSNYIIGRKTKGHQTA